LNDRGGRSGSARWSSLFKNDGGVSQALTAPDGVPLWVCEVGPYTKDMPVLADGSYEGAGHGVYVPVKKPKDDNELDVDTRTYNKLLRELRCLGERGFALLTQRWKSLQHVTISPRRVTDPARAALVLLI
jgi:hypothetical protein